MVDWLLQNTGNRAVISSAILLAIIFLGRILLMHRIRSLPGMSTEMRRRWTVQIRQGSLLLLALGLLYIWGTELRAFAISLVAITAAIVIATKELIMCISGSVLKTGSRAFAIGDRIEVNNIRGDVFDQNLLSTTLLEIGPGKSIHQHTGRTIIIPNSVFLSNPVINESFTDDYLLHVFTVPLKPTDDWQGAEAILLEYANQECAPFLADARQHMEKIGKAQGIQALSVEPRITKLLSEPDRISLLVRVPVPARRKGRIEQAILHRFMQKYYSKPLNETPVPPASHDPSSSSNASRP